MATFRDEDSVQTRTASSRAVSAVRSAVSYGLFAAGVLALWAFFAPHIGLPAVEWHAAVLPTIVAPSEGDAVVDAAPLIAGLVTCGLAVWLR